MERQENEAENFSLDQVSGDALQYLMESYYLIKSYQQEEEK